MNGKIQQTGKRVYFRVVKNLRVDGRPTNQLIKTVAAAPVASLKDNSMRVAVVAKIDAELKKLKAEGKISASDIDKIKGKFGKVWARPKKKPIDADLLERYPILKA